MKTIFIASVISALSLSAFSRPGGQDQSGRGFCHQVTSGYSNLAQAMCGAGEYAMNGGGDCKVVGNKRPFLIESVPVSGRDGLSMGWQTDCHFADNSAGAQARAVVTCCPL
jgi:hypothetical protein